MATNGDGSWTWENCCKLVACAGGAGGEQGHSDGGGDRGGAFKFPTEGIVWPNYPVFFLPC